MKKTIYEAPQMEQIQVRFEQNIMSDVQQVKYVEGNDWISE